VYFITDRVHAEFSEPEERVIKGGATSKECMFFILNGKYKVQGWLMKPKNK